LLFQYSFNTVIRNPVSRSSQLFAFSIVADYCGSINKVFSRAVFLSRVHVLKRVYFKRCIVKAVVQQWWLDP